jgi:WD40 repeat protein
MKLHNRMSLFVTSAMVLFALTTSSSLAQDVSAGPQPANQTKSPGGSESVPAAGVNLAACSGCRATIKVWRVEDGALLCRIPTETGSNPRLSFSADGRWLASSDGGLQINLWQLPEGTPKWSAPLAQHVSDMSFANGDQSVVVIFADGSSRRFPVK